MFPEMRVGKLCYLSSLMYNYIRHDGENWDEENLMSIYGNLIACLFYVELEATPRFYTLPVTCYLRVCCRIPPGPAQVDLLIKLRRDRVELLCTAAMEVQYNRVQFGTSEMVARCKRSQPFRERIRMQVQSASTLLDIKRKGAEKTSQSISHCPYMIGDLVRDQGRYACEKRGRQSEIGPEVAAQEHMKLNVALDKLFAALSQTY